MTICISIAETLLVPEDFCTFLESLSANEFRQKALNPPLVPTATDFYDVRDFLLFRIIQTNAQRPMAVLAITHKSVKRAKIDEEGGATITVS